MPGKRKPESSVLHSFEELLTHRRIYHMRINSGCVKVEDRYIRLAPSGTPDIIGILSPYGRFLGVEAKRGDGKGRLREAQRETLATIRSLGGVGIVCDDVRHLSNVLDLLERRPDVLLNVYGEPIADGNPPDLGTSRVQAGGIPPASIRGPSRTRRNPLLP